MSKLTIQTGTDNLILRQKSLPVKKVGKETLKLIKDMEETMKAENGVGIAAPQVGSNVRVVLVTFNLNTAQEQIVALINPEIIYKSREEELDEEGCLSVPKQFDQVWRSREVVVKFWDLNGKEKMLKLSGFNARVVQHEIDHLDGVLFVDRVEKVVIGKMAKKVDQHEQRL